MKALIETIKSKTNEFSFSGVISIFRGGEPLFNEAFGFADFANRRENHPATRFGIASGTKLFTALGIGSLIDEGRLSLDQTVHDALQQNPGWVSPRATIGQLLTHTSGIYDYYDEELVEDFDNFFVDIPWYNLKTPLDYLPLFEGKTAKFAPGERYAYSNGGYICLGMIIERITQKLYREVITERVLSPAGMSDSGFFAFNQLPGDTAFGYKKLPDGTRETNFYNLPAIGASDGGMYTTTHDLQKFWRALLDHAILSQALTERFLTPQVSIHPMTDYGYGVYISRRFKQRCYFIVGGDAGVGFDSRYFPDEDIVVNILSNETNGEEEIKEVLLEELNVIFNPD